MPRRGTSSKSVDKKRKSSAVPPYKINKELQADLEQKYGKCRIIESPDFDLTCPVCQEILCYPHKSVQCDHRLCLKCWDAILSSKNQCPMCRQKLRKKDLREDTESQELCLQLRAQCKIAGCHWSGPLFEFLDHINGCERNLEKLPDWVKEENKNMPQSITQKEEILLPSHILDQLHQHLPSASLAARAWTNYAQKNTRDSSNADAQGSKKKSDVNPELQHQKTREEIDLAIRELDMLKHSLTMKPDCRRLTPTKEDSSLDPNAKTNSSLKDRNSDEFVFDSNDENDSSDDEIKNIVRRKTSLPSPAPYIQKKMQKAVANNDNPKPRIVKKPVVTRTQMPRMEERKEVVTRSMRRSSSLKVSSAPTEKPEDCKNKHYYRNAIMCLADSFDHAEAATQIPRKRKFDEISNSDMSVSMDLPNPHRSKRANI